MKRHKAAQLAACGARRREFELLERRAWKKEVVRSTRIFLSLHQSFDQDDSGHPCGSRPRKDQDKMSTLFGSASSANTSNTLGDLSNDVALSSPPEDSVSDINFSTQSQHLAVASWDKKVRIYEINAQGGSSGVAAFDHEAPVLSCHWSPVSVSFTFTFELADMLLGWQEGYRRRSRQSCTYDGYDHTTNNSSRCS